MMKKTLTFMAVILMAMVAGTLVSCGGDDSNDGGGSASLDATKLIGKTFSSSDATYGVYDGAQKKYEVKFINERIATVHIFGRDLGDYGYERWDKGTVNCPYTISGNTVTIDYKLGDLVESIVMVFKNNLPVGWELTDDEGYSGEVVTDWLSTGYYFCKEASSIYAYCKACASAGDKEGINQVVSNYSGKDHSVIGVTEGNQLGVMYALARINQRPTDRDVIMLVNETFLGITVYIYTFPDCFVSGTTDWKTWKGWNYTGNAFNDPYGHTYNKIK